MEFARLNLGIEQFAYYQNRRWSKLLKRFNFQSWRRETKSRRTLSGGYVRTGSLSGAEDLVKRSNARPYEDF